MKTQYFNLHDGSLEFSDTKIIINDNARRDKSLQLFTYAIFIFLGFNFIYQWTIQGQKLKLFLGLLLIIVWPIRLIREWKNFKNTMTEIQLTDISHATFLSDLKQGFLTVLINLKLGGHRKIKLTFENNQEEILKTLFNDNQIKVD